MSLLNSHTVASASTDDSSMEPSCDGWIVRAWGRVCVRAWGRVCVRVWGRVCVRVWGRVCVRAPAAALALPQSVCVRCTPPAKRCGHSTTPPPWGMQACRAPQARCARHARTPAFPQHARFRARCAPGTHTRCLPGLRGWGHAPLAREKGTRSGATASTRAPASTPQLSRTTHLVHDEQGAQQHAQREDLRAVVLGLVKRVYALAVQEDLSRGTPTAAPRPPDGLLGGPGGRSLRSPLGACGLSRAPCACLAVPAPCPLPAFPRPWRSLRPVVPLLRATAASRRPGAARPAPPRCSALLHWPRDPPG